LADDSYVPVTDISPEAITECETLTITANENVDYCSVSFGFDFSIIISNIFF
jgi:hypothetical protein